MTQCTPAYVAFRDVAFGPKSVPKPYPPLWVGGDSRAAIRRAASVGDGWIPSKIRLEDLPNAASNTYSNSAMSGPICDRSMYVCRSSLMSYTTITGH
jgi:alkanesulfonate monooxygenase SsuD/methylene tetrahydromethanopterin reductase-like flavin-dependent oxidoreductase (luciferase family)